ncbi:type I-D CRISPR-associated protein Cas5/Csc1 [Tumebacillus avium]|uniref:Type I-D CRISPR-associated protein Cas5/Csc1 n=1 Tax=Tumebacillus avium TaxID=1903704 RepID=A0A1Y0IM02_9BACL|nr:type I-D CRISPR-associated protein Cas5/Csc1 [Tumebacillus avium]ARU61527.1 type I-D CRISPR-associated protein Cas5/Csc1 [Tumebacillus avium]
MSTGVSTQAHFRDPQMRIFHVKLIPHDILWFASFDAGAVTVTEPAIHNYALSYAVSRYERAVSFSDQPTYELDLEQMDWYATPAKAKRFARLKFTWNAIDTMTQTTETPNFEKTNSPKMGTRHVLAPAPATEFEFYLFSRKGEIPPRMIRLGKKRAPCVLKWEEVKHQGPVKVELARPTHLVNPLDVVGEFEQYRMVSIPPSFLADDAYIRQGLVVRGSGHEVVVPRRLLDWDGEK